MDILSRIERTEAPERQTSVFMKTRENTKKQKQLLVGQLWSSLKQEIPEQLRFVRKHLVWYRSHFSTREHLLADLYCPQAKLVVLFGQAPIFSLNDEIRDARLRDAGYQVLRLHLKEEGGIERWSDRIKEVLLQTGLRRKPTQLMLDLKSLAIGFNTSFRSC